MAKAALRVLAGGCVKQASDALGIRLASDTDGGSLEMPTYLGTGTAISGGTVAMTRLHIVRALSTRVEA